MGHPDQARPEWKGLYRAGGISLIAAGILVLVTIPLIPLLVPSLAPSTVQSGLQSVQSQSLLFGATWGLYLISDILFLIPFPVFYLALRNINRGAALMSVIFNTVFVTIDIGVQIPLRLSLINLANSYASANTAQQAAYLATAQLNMDLSNLVALVATFAQFLAVILVSYTMLKSGTFKRSTGYVGIVGGILGLVFIPAFAIGSQLSGLFNIAGFVLLVIWSLIAGFRMYKLS